MIANMNMVAIFRYGLLARFLAIRFETRKPGGFPISLPVPDQVYANYDDENTEYF